MVSHSAVASIQHVAAADVSQIRNILLLTVAARVIT